jgi:UDP-glucose 4-epimerase
MPPSEFDPRDSVAGRTVLVTGGAGFVGSHLARALDRAREVRVLDDLSAGRRERVPDHATLIEGDVRDRRAIERATAGVDVIFHQAAVVSVERSTEVPLETHTVNVGGTLALLEAARREDARFVSASSAAVYGEPEEVPIRESDSKRPKSPYGIEKLAVDHYCRRYHDLYGLETIALRYFNVYGPEQSGGQYSGVIDVFCRQADSGEAITVHGDGTQTRDFVHVRDVVDANLRAVATDVVGEAMNVATGESVTIRELAELIREYTGASVPIQETSPREGDVAHSRGDITKARRALGYEPTVSIEEGIEQLLRRRSPRTH